MKIRVSKYPFSPDFPPMSLTKLLKLSTKKFKNLNGIHSLFSGGDTNEKLNKSKA